ncbi:uncharacterized protein LOC127873705 [Dreissena polymorpha]|uniref:Uncharacterized protein n=1 Tax=Dreissena polymorpha TaxID=45954 RepID=A0A9D4QYS3_DREPO|nr:uncharacterized protein LOC127873705 [Dreissena polymorpha]KAH3847772.1 hypothetical protein DPMN_090103 [Dreissena polymorpha]
MSVSIRISVIPFISFLISQVFLGATQSVNLGYLSLDRPTFVGRDVVLYLELSIQLDMIDIRQLHVYLRLENEPEKNWNDFRAFVVGKNTMMIELVKLHQKWKMATVLLDYRSSRTNTITIGIQDFPNACGYLYRLSTSFAPEKVVELAYYPTQDAINHPDIYYRGWRKKAGEIINLENGFYEERRDGPNTKYILSIYNFTDFDTFYLECVRKNSIFKTHDVNLAVGRPRLGPLCKVGHCKECVCVRSGDPVTCTTTSPDVHVMIDKESVRLQPPRQDGNIFTFTIDTFTADSSFHRKTIQCVAETNFTSNEIYKTEMFVIDRPLLGPLCTWDTCINCICVFPGDSITCTAVTSDVHMTINNANTILLSSKLNETTYTFETMNFTIDKSYHWTKVECWYTINEINEDTHTSANLIVFARPLLLPPCPPGTCTDCVCISPGESITCISSTPSVKMKVDQIDASVKLKETNKSVYIFESENVTVDWDCNNKTVECISSINSTNTAVIKVTIYITAPPQLGSLCSVHSCKECVCVKVGDHVTCSAYTPDVKLTVDGTLLGLQLQYSNGTWFTYVSVDAMDESYNGKTIECISNMNTINENTSAISKIFVLELPSSAHVGWFTLYLLLGTGIVLSVSLVVLCRGRIAKHLNIRNWFAAVSENNIYRCRFTRTRRHELIPRQRNRPICAIEVIADASDFDDPDYVKIADGFIHTSTDQTDFCDSGRYERLRMSRMEAASYLDCDDVVDNMI